MGAVWRQFLSENPAVGAELLYLVLMEFQLSDDFGDPTTVSTAPEALTKVSSGGCETV